MVRCEASRDLKWTIENTGVMSPIYKIVNQDDTPLYQISKPNPNAEFWTMFYFKYAGHQIPPKRIEVSGFGACGEAGYCSWLGVDRQSGGRRGVREGRESGGLTVNFGLNEIGVLIISLAESQRTHPKKEVERVSPSLARARTRSRSGRRSAWVTRIV